MKPGSGPVIALSFLEVAQDLATATDPASPIDIGGFDIPIQAAGMLLAGAAQYEGRATSRIRANALRARHSSNPTQNARLTLTSGGRRYLLTGYIHHLLCGGRPSIST